MTLLLPTLAVALAAFCVWLTVRIVNRKERWAKWTLAGTVGLPVLYVASFGPACWIFSRLESPLPGIYVPFTAVIDSQTEASRFVIKYAQFGMHATGEICLPPIRDGLLDDQNYWIYNNTAGLEIGVMIRPR